MLYKTAQETYFDRKGIIAYYERLGKTATADYFRSLNDQDCQIVCTGGIGWIPASFVRTWCELSAVTPAHAKERFQEIEYDVIQWLPMGDESPEEVARMYAAVAAKNN